MYHFCPNSQLLQISTGFLKIPVKSIDICGLVKQDVENFKRHEYFCKALCRKRICCTLVNYKKLKPAFAQHFKMTENS